MEVRRKILLRKFVVGDHQQSVREGKELFVQADQVKIHPKYQHRSLLYDIALLRLSKRINFETATHIGPICLPSFEFKDYKNNEPAMTVGWGATNIEYNVEVGPSGEVLFFGQDTRVADILKKINLRSF